jgi:hypothetical protein
MMSDDEEARMYQWNLTVEFGPVHLEAANKVKAALAQLGVADVDDMGDANECVINGLIPDGRVDEFKPLPVARIIEPLLLPHQLPWSVECWGWYEGVDEDDDRESVVVRWRLPVPKAEQRRRHKVQAAHERPVAGLCQQIVEMSGRGDHDYLNLLDKAIDVLNIMQRNHIAWLGEPGPQLTAMIDTYEILRVTRFAQRRPLS